MTGPQLLPRNQLDHFYRGGERLAAWRRAGPPTSERQPEEWLASMTTMSGQAERGLSRLADGTFLRDAIIADPVGWLGEAHVEAAGPSTELLVKLLDAGQRLPVHLHPDRAFARRHLGLGHGKTEAWIILEVDAGAGVRLGFAQPMGRATVRDLVDRNDSGALLGALRGIDVRPGDGILVPAGVPHSIDAGVFVLELQEPTDLSIILETEDMPVDLRRDGHLGLGFDVALDALTLDPVDTARLVVRAAAPRLLPPAADPYFRATRAGAEPAGFAVVVVDSGAGRLVAAEGAPLDIARGDVAVLPHRAGPWRLDGPVTAIVCRPPEPQPAGPP
jgi:mannose-6-phosphate isomerase